MENWKKNAVELIAGLTLTEKADPSVIGYQPQKIRALAEVRPAFPRSSPERHGISASRIAALIDDLEAEPLANIRGLMIVKDGAVVCEVNAPGYSRRIPSLAHSMSKTVTGIAIGMLFDEGKIDLESKVVSYFPDLAVTDPRFSSMTVENLLDMSSGVSFAEAGTVTEVHWLSAFFSSSLTFAPGTDFAYNSMNTYVLSRILTEITGEGLTEYLAPRLFSPLGITEYLWEIGNEGYEKGGWGLYLSTEDWCKIGQMLLDGGVYRGKRILSENWVRRATAPHRMTPVESGDFDYGYQIWVSRDGSDFLLNGMLGQNVWVCPEKHIVAAIAAGNNELFSQSPALGILLSHLKDEIPLSPERAVVTAAALADKERRFFLSRQPFPLKKVLHGVRFFLHFLPRRPYDPAWDAVLGTYRLRRNNAGVLPLLVRMMQNNFTGGIESVTLEKDGAIPVLTVRERTGEVRIPLGLYEPTEAVIEVRGEIYRVRATAAAQEDERGYPVFKILLVFPELPNTRLIVLSPKENGEIAFTMSEEPDERLPAAFFSTARHVMPLSLLLDRLSREYGADFLEKRLHEAYHPSLFGCRADLPDCEARLAEADLAHEEELRSYQKLLSLLSMFTGESTEKSSLLGSALRLLFAKKQGF